MVIPQKLLRAPATEDGTQELTTTFFTCSQSMLNSYNSSIDAVRFQRFSKNLETKFFSELKERLNDLLPDYKFE